jgi:hypothetical protein
MARNGEGLVAAAFWVGGRMTWCKYGPVILHTQPTILPPVNGLDKIHCAFYSKEPG